MHMLNLVLLYTYIRSQFNIPYPVSYACHGQASIIHAGGTMKLTFLSLTAPRLNNTTLLTIMTAVMKTGKTKKTAHLHAAKAS